MSAPSGNDDFVSDQAANLRSAFSQADWASSDLWLAAVALGGDLTRREVAQITTAARMPTRLEHRVLAAALNERLLEIGRHQRVPAWSPPPP